jgi:hypothetical protein
MRNGQLGSQTVGALANNPLGMTWAIHPAGKPWLTYVGRSYVFAGVAAVCVQRNPAANIAIARATAIMVAVAGLVLAPLNK